MIQSSEQQPPLLIPFKMSSKKDSPNIITGKRGPPPIRPSVNFTGSKPKALRIKYNEFEVEQLLREIEAKTILNERISSGIPAESMIKKCSFQGVLCDHR